MRTLILHLSDIHIGSAGDLILTRASRIADAVRDIDHQVDLCVLVITGDVAFSGKADEYHLAAEWLSELRDCMRGSLRGSAAIEVVAIPGNHDCDFTTTSRARASLIESMVRDPEIATDPASAATCVRPQHAFFEFRNKNASNGLVLDGPLYYEYRFTANGETVLFRCLNTAWVSQKQENPAKLTFPGEVVPTVPPVDGSVRDTLVVTVMHHTLNWLAPGNTRVVRRRLQSVSDFILTGHEHEFDLNQTRDQNGGAAVYVDGLALQSHGAAPHSGFNAILVDTLQKQYRVVPFLWKESRYQEDPGAPCQRWTSFTTNPLRTGHVFPVNAEMCRLLADPGITLLHPTRGRLGLDDIFVYPDLREVTEEPKSRSKRLAIAADRLLELSLKTGRLLVTGEEESGKTALAKRLFLDALEEGLVPLLLDGRSVRLRGNERDRKELGQVFEEQYDAQASGYLDLPRDKRVILLDDASALSKVGSISADILDYLAHFAGRVILFADQVTQLVQEIAGLAPLATGRVPFTHYRLLPMGHLRREELIDRYVGLASDGDPERGVELRTDMRRILAVAVGKYFAPPTPIAVVSILQARAFNEQLNLHQSTYGYYYELLIKRQLLGQSSSIQEMDVRLAYLTELAYALFCEGMSRWSETWMMKFHEQFVSERRLRLGFRDVIAVLVEHGVLAAQLNAFEFHYPYIYYYFVARALAERITTAAGRERILELTRRLHEQDSANILLFLTHHSKDPAILEPMLAQADSLFEESPRAELNPGGSALPGLDEALHEAVFVDRPAQELRRDYLSRMDALEEHGDSAAQTSDQAADASAGTDLEVGREGPRGELDSVVQEVLGLVSRIFVSLRTMQILGQLLKNFPGSLTGQQKEAITLSVYGVALRTLGHMHELFRQHTDEFATQVVEALRHEHPEMSSNELMFAAQRTVYWQMYMATIGITQRTAADVGSPLLEPVFSDIERSDPVPSVRLISLALKLDRAVKFPESAVRSLHEELGKNPLAQRVLQGLVVIHFHLFEVPREIKQSICALLDIEYRPMLPKSRTRLVGPVT